MRILLHIPYLSSLRNFLQSGFLDFVMSQDVHLSLIAATRERGDLDTFLARWPGRVDFIPQEPLFPADFATRLRRRWRTILHGLSLELLRRENVTFHRQANRHSFPVRLVCRTPGLEWVLRRLYPYLDYLLPVSPRMAAVLRQARPDVVAGVACLADTVEIDVFRAARTLKIPSAMIIHSWDNPAGRGAPPVVPDRWILWGEEMQGHVMRYYGVSRDDTEIAGPVQLSIYSDEALAVCDRGAFLKEIGLDPNREVVLYAPTPIHLSYSDMPVLRLLLEYARSRPEVQLWFRPHPHSRELQRTLAFARERGIFVDPNFLGFVGTGLQERRYMPDLGFYPHMLHAVDVMVSNASTISLECALVGRPIVIIGFDCPPDGVERVALTLEENLQHPPLQPLLEQDAVILARRREDLFAAIGRGRRMRETDPGALERLRRAANCIAAVSDGKVFQRLFSAVIPTRRRARG